MPLGALRRAIWEPKWSQFNYWAPIWDRKGWETNAKVETQRFVPEQLVQDTCGICSHAQPDAKKRALHVLALPGFMLRLLRLFEALRGSLGAVAVSKAFRNPF